MIVGLSGKKGAGKSTVARYLHRRIDGAVILPFAEPMKDICVRLFGAERLQVDGTNEQKNTVTACGLTGREVQQRVGSVMRGIWPACWVMAWKNEVDAIRAEYGGAVPIIVPDLRFDNEAFQILGMGGIILRLTRSPHEPDLHESETALDRFREWSAVIDNAFMDERETCVEALDVCRRMGVV